jgi:hypothetical protein
MLSLTRDKRYLFYKKIPNSTELSTFRASFMNCTDTMLLVKFYSDEVNSFNIGLRMIPLEWIVAVKSIEDIIGGKTSLPSVILHVIDNSMNENRKSIYI